MLLVAKFPRLSWYVHKARTCILIGPFRHRLINAVDPTQQKICSQVVVPHLQHGSYLPEMIATLWWVLLRVSYVAKHFLKAPV